MSILEIVKLTALINIMVIPHMSAKVVTVPVIIVMVKMIMNVLHVLQPSIWLMITPVKIVTLPVMDVQQQELITVMHVQLNIMTHQEFV